jgi:peptide deformylase
MKMVDRYKSQLKMVSKPIDFETDNVDQYVKTIYKRMNDYKGAQGLSGVQAGILKRIAICRFKQKDAIVIINPEIIWQFGKRNSNEGCAFSTGRYIVKRPIIGKVKWFDFEGKEIVKILTYKKLRIFCHELDHMNGVCPEDIGTTWKYSNIYYNVKRKMEAK